MTPEPGSAVEALIQRCLQGDQIAWEQIVRQYWRKVFNVAYKFVGKHDEAEDLAQDIFLKIFKSLDTFDRRANFQTWLISISRICASITTAASARSAKRSIATSTPTSCRRCRTIRARSPRSNSRTACSC